MMTPEIQMEINRLKVELNDLNTIKERAEAEERRLDAQILEMERQSEALTLISEGWSEIVDYIERAISEPQDLISEAEARMESED